MATVGADTSRGREVNIFSPRPVIYSGFSDPTRDSPAVSFQTAILNLTERRSSEAKLRRARDELEVRVDDIDQNGKLSLSIVGDEAEGSGDSSSDGDDRAAGDAPARSDRAPRATASFEDFWEGQAREEFGDLGPAEDARGGAGTGTRALAQGRRTTADPSGPRRREPLGVTL